MRSDIAFQGLFDLPRDLRSSGIAEHAKRAGELVRKVAGAGAGRRVEPALCRLVGGAFKRIHPGLQRRQVLPPEPREKLSGIKRAGFSAVLL